MAILGSKASQLIRSFLQPLLATIDSVSKGGSLGSLVVSFTPANSGPAATSFTVTSSPGGITASGASSPITVTGLNPGTSYSFTVVASNAVGSSAASAPSSSLAASQYICPSGGSPSGSNCNYGATAYTDYSCPGWPGLPILVGGCQTGGQYYNVVNNGLNHACFQGSGSSYACCVIDGYGDSRSPACTAFTNYFCSAPASRSGTTCTYAASIG
jgi:trimeric autotransporter adhesin